MEEQTAASLQPSEESEQLPWNAIACVAIVLATTAAYANSFQGAFVFDDIDAIVNNPFIRRLAPFGFVFHFLSLHMRPLTDLSLAVNYHFGQLNPMGYHLVNFVIHVMAALTLFGIVRRTLLSERLKERFGSAATALAFITALVWAVHPLATESVTYVVQRAESLMGLFFLLTLYCVIRGRSGGRLWNYLAVLACALGMASKQVMVVAPVVVLAYDRIFISTSFRQLAKRWPMYLGLAATWGILVWLIMSNQSGGTAGFANREWTWWSYLATQMGAIAHYLRQVFWPSGQCLDYGWPAAQTVGEIVPPALLIVALACLTLWALWRKPGMAFLGVAFFLILAPTSSIMPIADAAAEHRMYLPMAAVLTAAIVLAFLAGQGVVRQRPAWGKVMSCFAWSAISMAAVGLVVTTICRNSVYRSPLALWQDAVEKYPLNARAHLNVGDALRAERDYPKAVQAFSQSLLLDPDNAKAYGNRAVAYASQNKPDKAVKDLDKAIELAPGYAPFRLSRGMVYTMLFRFDDALKDMDEAIRLNPCDELAYYNRAVCHFRNRKYDLAWKDVQSSRKYGGRPPADFISSLERASGRKDD